VKRFNADGDHGLIAPGGGTAGVFVHRCAIQASSFRALEKNQRVELTAHGITLLQASHQDD
jgi:cold shock CspA family protein